MGLFRKHEVKKEENSYNTSATEITGNLQSFSHREITKKISDEVIQAINTLLNDGLNVEYGIRAWFGIKKNISVYIEGKIDEENVEHVKLLNVTVHEEIDLADAEEKIINCINKYFKNKYKVEQLLNGKYTINSF